MTFRLAIASALALTVATAAWAQGNYTGRVKQFDPAGNTLHMQDGTIVHLEPGTTVMVDGRPVSLNHLTPGSTVTIIGAQPTMRAPGHYTGRVKHFDAASNTLHMEDGTIVRLQPGTTAMVDGRPVPVTQLTPGSPVAIIAGQPTPPAIAAQPTAPAAGGQPTMPADPPAAAIGPDRWAGHPPIDAAGVVADVDHQTGRVTFEDGRAVKITDGSTVWEPTQLRSVNRGDRVLLRDALPTGFTAGAAASPHDATMRQHMGTVLKVDGDKAKIVLNDGRVVKITPQTSMSMDDRRMVLSDLQPGDQLVIAVVGPAATRAAQPTPGQVGASPAPAREDAVSALVREDWPVVELEARDIRIMRRPQAP
jgi:Cu/Ag efflux protein CusF